jgi:hypothetical protein
MKISVRVDVSDGKYCDHCLMAAIDEDSDKEYCFAFGVILYKKGHRCFKCEECLEAIAYESIDNIIRK